MPPGIIHVEETPLKKASNCPNEIRNVVPNDNIFKRHKVEQRITQSDQVWNNISLKKSETIAMPISKAKGKGPSQGVSEQYLLDKDQLTALYKKHHLDVQCEKDSANDVNFEKLF